MPIDRRKFLGIAIESAAMYGLAACAQELKITLTPEAVTTTTPTSPPTLQPRTATAVATQEFTPTAFVTKVSTPRSTPDPTETRKLKPPRPINTATSTPRPRLTSIPQGKATVSAEAAKTPEHTKPLNDYFIWKGNPNKPNVALTFDDGWLQVENLLNALKETKTRLTLFPTGQALANPANIVSWKGLLALGCEFSCHSYTHDPVENQTTDQIVGEIRRSQQELNKTMGQNVPYAYYRPPYGGRSRNLVEALKITRLTGYIWSFSSDGTSILSSPWLVQQRIVNNVKSGDIVLQHFNYNDVTNLAQIIDGLRKKGLTPTLLREVV